MNNWTHISMSYWTDGNSVYLQGEKLRGQIDIKSFKPLSDNYSKDINSVWHSLHVIKGADPKTFKILNHIFSHDKNFIYHFSVKLDEADHDTFQVLDNGLDNNAVNWESTVGYAKDANNVFSISSATGKASIIKNADPATFISFGNSYGRDSKNVFYERAKIVGADPLSWRPLSLPYSCDKKHVYYEKKRVKGADPFTFETLTDPSLYDKINWWGRDVNGYYRVGEPSRSYAYQQDLKSSIEVLQKHLKNFQDGEKDRYFTESILRITNPKQWIENCEKNEIRG
ncbi:DKNYY domain-containing protein [Lentisphaera profundi]|uniref:DKNYY domain-containing protein n=1 Tax=Lentisphaera profundi TaxID=1658616 RepID=A0ABY7VQH0_9BACT|nr:DKNYY domain-containing protein [Lentisphaera profundi]WDE95564.1 DKNYY domain-containing protein [Lentisphaera profundi]